MTVKFECNEGRYSGRYSGVLNIIVCISTQQNEIASLNSMLLLHGIIQRRKLHHRKWLWVRSAYESTINFFRHKQFSSLKTILILICNRKTYFKTSFSPIIVITILNLLNTVNIGILQHIITWQLLSRCGVMQFLNVNI